VQELIKEGYPGESDGFETAVNFFEMQERPDAICTSNSLSASGVLSASFPQWSGCRKK
jgi:DNA-binding LacI/PurR family transcriptional regulator